VDVSLMRAVLFLNGEILNLAASAARLRDNDFLIGVDGGTMHCLALGRTPHAVVGDLDSLSPEQIADLSAKGVAFERHPVAKNETDLELALEYAIARGAHEILMLAAVGDRLDQTLANLLILAQREWPARIVVAEDDELAEILRGGESMTLTSPVGSTVSAIPLSTEVTGITYTGMVYPLNNHTLRFGSTRGLSNEIAETPATVRIRSGVLLVVYAG
jgi:thiamine pyrophosphokinase